MIIDLGIEKLNKILAEQKMAIMELEIKLKKVVIEKSDLSVDFQHLSGIQEAIARHAVLQIANK